MVPVAALKTNLTISDNYNKPSLSSGHTVPVETEFERAITQAALNCAEKYFDDKEKQGLPIPTAMIAAFSTSPSSRAKKASAVVAEMPRACVTRGANVPREEPRI